MSQKKLKNIAASKRALLLNFARKHNINFQTVLMRYGIEGLLLRLSKSAYLEQFVLKGAALFSIWMEQPYRPTQDVDFLGFGTNDLAEVAQKFREIIQTVLDHNEADGLEFDLSSILVERIRDDERYQGVRVTMKTYLHNAEIPLQIDVGFGDAITPRAQKQDYPTLLRTENPKVLAYPIQSVLSEKFEAMVSLGLANSRLKDYSDLFHLAQTQTLDGQLLRDAIRATFERRETAIPQTAPIALSDEFLVDPDKIKQWVALFKKYKLEPPADLASAGKTIENFLMPVAKAAAANSKFRFQWIAGAWQPMTNWQLISHTAERLIDRAAAHWNQSEETSFEEQVEVIAGDMSNRERENHVVLVLDLKNGEFTGELSATLPDGTTWKAGTVTSQNWTGLETQLIDIAKAVARKLPT